MSRVVIRISSDAMKTVKARAKAKGCTEGEAADALIKTANGRNAAVARYAPAVKKKAKRKAAAKRPARAAVKKARAARKVAAPKPAKKRVRKPKAAPESGDGVWLDASKTVEQTELS